MDSQSMQGGRDGAVQEFFYGGGGGGGGQPGVDVDGAFLMELLDDTAPVADQAPGEDAADDRLSRVIRSLEAEICGGKAPAAVGDGESTVDGPASDDGVLEDMLSDFGSSPDPCSAGASPPAPTALAPFEYWAEAPPAMGDDMGGWHVDGDGFVVGYEFREQCYYAYADGSSVEQVYSPLWE